MISGKWKLDVDKQWLPEPYKLNETVKANTKSKNRAGFTSEINVLMFWIIRSWSDGILEDANSKLNCPFSGSNEGVRSLSVSKLEGTAAASVSSSWTELKKMKKNQMSYFVQTHIDIDRLITTIDFWKHYNHHVISQMQGKTHMSSQSILT